MLSSGIEKMIQFCHIQTTFLKGHFSVNTVFNDLQNVPNWFEESHGHFPTNLKIKMESELKQT